jgi:hypothetical protein
MEKLSQWYTTYVHIHSRAGAESIRGPTCRVKPNFTAGYQRLPLRPIPDPYFLTDKHFTKPEPYGSNIVDYEFSRGTTRRTWYKFYGHQSGTV